MIRIWTLAKKKKTILKGERAIVWNGLKCCLIKPNIHHGFAQRIQTPGR